MWWPETESNCRHEDFQSSALPTELSGPKADGRTVLRKTRFYKALKRISKMWWPETESNCRHEDFQSSALPTELSGRGGAY